MSPVNPDRLVPRAAAVASLILVVAGVASLLVLSYFLLFEARVTQRWSASWPRILLHYVGPAFVAGLCFVGLRLKPDHRINLVIVCVTLAASLYGAEVVLRIMEPSFLPSGVPVLPTIHASADRESLAAKLANQVGFEIDARDRLEFVADLQKKGIDAVPFAIPRYQTRYNESGRPPSPPRLLTLGGISNRLTVLCNETGKYVVYDSDEHGFRNARGIWNSERLDIVALGDSFTQGYCVPSGKYFVDLVRQRYPATLNLAIAGQGPLLMLAMLREYAASFRPRVVLWFYFEGNDLYDLLDEMQSVLLLRYLGDDFSQWLLARQVEIDQALVSHLQRHSEKSHPRVQPPKAAREEKGFVRASLEFIKLRRLRARFRKIQMPTQPPKDLLPLDAGLQGADMRLFRTILAQARTSVIAWGGTLYFVYLPSYTRFDPRVRRFINEQVGEGRREAVLSVMRDLLIPVIDVLPVFQGHIRPMSLFPFGAPGHYAEDAHRLVAEEVLRAIGRRQP